MDELRKTVSRIDENLRLLREDIVPLVEKVEKNTQDIVIIKTDKKWMGWITNTLFGLMGVIAGAVAEFLRK